jgi:hypothetical protein
VGFDTRRRQAIEPGATDTATVTDTDAPEVFGSPPEEAAAALAGPDTPDEATVAETIELLAEDGVVSRDRLDEAVAGLSKVVSTPETRVEVAEREVESAREAAEGLTDVPAVAARLDGLDPRLDRVASDVEALGPRLSGIVDRAGDPDAVYEVARDIRRLTEDANAAQTAADEIRDDAERTKRWLRSDVFRHREVVEELDAVEESVDGLERAVDWLAGDADGAPAGVDPDDPGACWADAAVSARVNALLVADLRAELADARTVAERNGEDADYDDLAARLDDLAARRDRLAARLDDLAAPAWREAHADRVDRAETVLAAHDPPVDWGAVRAALDGV